MNKNIAALVSGLLFGLGLAVSQMVNPAKVIGFLDVAGRWDPSLAFVMVGAIGVAFVFFRIILKSPAPKFDPLFKVPDIKAIDRNLIVGSGIFGMGWGLVGFCPGPAISSLAYGRIEPVIFLAAMFIGFYVERVWRLRAGYG
ncbi:MAG: YeeE/YedE family protein [Rhodospirillales bacterium]|jgi:uncharacterized membrane protein YedE/YeeE